GGTRSRRGRPSRRKACCARRASLIRIDRGNGGMLMLKKVLAVAAMVAILGVPALATEQADHSTQGKPVVVPTATSHLGMALGFGLAIAAFGGAISQSNAIAKAVDAVARQPE